MEIITNQNNYNSNTSLSTPTSQTNIKSVNDLSCMVYSTILVLQNENLRIRASDYTYTQYKKLSAKDINQLFPRYKTPFENEKAQKLQQLATLSSDEILNQVLFDKAKNADFSDISTRNFFDKTLSIAELEKAELSWNKYEISPEDIKVKKETYKNMLYKDVLLTKEFSFSSAEDTDWIVDAKTYFGFYQTSENYFKEYGKDLSEYSQKYWPGEFTLLNEIKSEYERRVSKNDNALS